MANTYSMYYAANIFIERHLLHQWFTNWIQISKFVVKKISIATFTYKNHKWDVLVVLNHNAHTQNRGSTVVPYGILNMIVAYSMRSH